MLLPMDLLGRIFRHPRICHPKLVTTGCRPITLGIQLVQLVHKASAGVPRVSVLVQVPRASAAAAGVEAPRASVVVVGVPRVSVVVVQVPKGTVAVNKASCQARRGLLVHLCQALFRRHMYHI